MLSLIQTVHLNPGSRLKLGSDHDLIDVHSHLVLTIVVTEDDLAYFAIKFAQIDFLGHMSSRGYIVLFGKGIHILTNHCINHKVLYIGVRSAPISKLENALQGNFRSEQVVVGSQSLIGVI